MTLTLDHVQRLNLYALLGAQRGNVEDIRLCWRMLDRCELTPEERRLINLRLEPVGEGQRPVWDPDKSLEPRAFEFSEEEARKIGKIINEWAQGFSAGFDRVWLEPLLRQLEPVITVNGTAHAAAEAPVPPRR